jgi:hypothetical protein
MVNLRSCPFGHPGSPWTSRCDRSTRRGTGPNLSLRFGPPPAEGTSPDGRKPEGAPQMENLIKLHKAQLASDRMSCHNATANQVRLALHTAAFWLMHCLRSAIPPTNPLARCEFATLRERPIKIGARVIEPLPSSGRCARSRSSPAALLGRLDRPSTPSGIIPSVRGHRDRSGVSHRLWLK